MKRFFIMLIAAFFFSMTGHSLWAAPPEASGPIVVRVSGYPVGLWIWQGTEDPTLIFFVADETFEFPYGAGNFCGAPIADTSTTFQALIKQEGFLIQVNERAELWARAYRGNIEDFWNDPCAFLAGEFVAEGMMSFRSQSNDYFVTLTRASTLHWHWEGTLYGYEGEPYHGTIRYNNLILKNGDFHLDRYEVVLK